ncbi:MAG: hypothetical protein U0793_05470 [Gemmataceae bacterium]
MSLVKHSCPSCGKGLRLKAEARSFSCPACGAALRLGPGGLEAPRTPSRGAWLLAGALAVGVLALGTVAVILISRGGGEKGSEVPSTLASLELPSGKPSTGPVARGGETTIDKSIPLTETKIEPKAEDTSKGSARFEAPPGPLAGKAGDGATAGVKPAGRVVVGEVRPAAHPGVDQKAVDRAIDRGVAFLKAKAAEETLLGAKALAGLALLHCDVPATDPAVRRLAAEVREHAARRFTPYDIAACIFFLDRLRDKVDAPLIRHLGLRLLANQQENGGWGYNCVQITPAQEMELVRRLGGDPRLGVAMAKGPPPRALGPFGTDTLPADAASFPVLRYIPGGKLPPAAGFGRSLINRPDNSITQFAVLGLLASKRHGVPAERSLAMAAERFRTSQGRDGAWRYGGDLSVVAGGELSDTATCAGLLALACAETTRGGRADDPVVASALAYLGRRLETLTPLPMETRRKRAAAASADYRAMVIFFRGMEAGLDAKNPLAFAGEVLKALEGGGGLGLGGGGVKTAHCNTDAWGDIYFLWSLERTAVAYGLKTFGKRDWYAFGAPLLVECQEADGGWREAFPGACDTAFALLFLRRANLFTEVTAALQESELPPGVGERDRQRSVSPGAVRGGGSSGGEATAGKAVGGQEP